MWKKALFMLFFSKFYYFHTKNLLWQSILHFSLLKLKLKEQLCVDHCNTPFVRGFPVTTRDIP